jgi:hypothetical protein
MHRVLASLVGLALLGLVANQSAGATDPRPIEPQQPPQQAVKNIDIVICLDVSGSMNGLLDSARVRLWDIINEMAKIQPSPKLRVGLYSYGRTDNAATGHIRKEIDLTTDLDALYQKLFALKIGGSLEFVTRVCRDATEQQPWAQDKDALKIIFVCGNEPASQDKLVSRQQAADLAKKHGIIINPIYCGNRNDADARDWILFAQQSGGRFSHIDQRGGTVAINAPQDKKLAELGAQMNSTYVAYGKAGEAKAQNQLAQDKNAAQYGAGVNSARIAAKNSGLYRCDDWDLVDRCKNDKAFDVTKLAVEELPEAMKKLNVEQRVAYVKDMTAKRVALQQQIDELSKQRTVYVNEQMRKNATAGAQAFDAALRETLRIQAKERGITIPE